MTTSEHTADVIDLAAARRARNRKQRVPVTQLPAPRRKANAQTVILSATMDHDGEEIHRHIGINDSLTLEDLRSVLCICFGLDPEDRWFFRCVVDNGPLPSNDEFIHAYLGAKDDWIIMSYQVNLVHVDVVDSIIRDESTPQAVCIGGYGALDGEVFETSAVNAAIMSNLGEDNVLDNVHPDVARLIERSGVYDFVPLLQALGVNKESRHPIPGELRRLPAEESGMQRDAYWAMLLSLACMSDEELTDSVAISLMSSLGYGEMSIEEITALCQRSLDIIEQYGCYGDDCRCAVDRIDIYRELLRTE